MLHKCCHSLQKNKMNFSIENLFRICDQICRIWSHLLKKFLMKYFIFWYSDFWFVYPNFWYRDNYFENLLRSDWFGKISIISLFLKVRRNDLPRKFSIRRNNNNGISIKTGCIVIAHLLTCSDQEKCMYTTIFELITIIKLYLHFFIYKYNFSCSLFRTTHKLINDRKII